MFGQATEQATFPFHSWSRHGHWQSYWVWSLFNFQVSMFHYITCYTCARDWYVMLTSLPICYIQLCCIKWWRANLIKCKRQTTKASVLGKAHKLSRDQSWHVHQCQSSKDHIWIGAWKNKAPTATFYCCCNDKVLGTDRQKKWLEHEARSSS